MGRIMMTAIQFISLQIKTVRIHLNVKLLNGIMIIGLVVPMFCIK